MKIGEYVKLKRESKKWFQYELAKKANIQKTNLSGIEKYNKMPKFDIVCRLCEALNITPTELWENIRDEYIGIEKIPKEGDARQKIPNPERADGWESGIEAEE